MSLENENEFIQQVEMHDEYLNKLYKQRIFFDSAANLKAQYSKHAYKQLRTQVLSELEILQARSVLVTGPTAGVGKTTVSLNLAFSMAKLPGKKVILVDLDFRGSSMQKVLDIKRDYGTERIADVDFSFNRATLKIQGCDLRILTCAERQLDSSEILLSSAAITRLSALRNLPPEYIVIFDSPPILGCDDVSAILPSMEAVVMVVAEGGTSRRELSNAMDRLENLPVIGTVLNKSKDSDIHKYYY